MTFDMTSDEELCQYIEDLRDTSKEHESRLNNFEVRFSIQEDRLTNVDNKITEAVGILKEWRASLMRLHSAEHDIQVLQSGQTRLERGHEIALEHGKDRDQKIVKLEKDTIRTTSWQDKLVTVILVGIACLTANLAALRFWGPLKP